MLQVRRVLRKLYRFITLVHSNVEGLGDTGSSIGIAQEISMLDRELPILDHELKSAFPGNEWLAGKHNKKIKSSKEVKLIIKSFKQLIDKFVNSARSFCKPSHFGIH